MKQSENTRKSYLLEDIYFETAISELQNTDPADQTLTRRSP